MNASLFDAWSTDVWCTVSDRVRDAVSNAALSGPEEIRFERIPKGFRVSRESPQVVIERWFDGDRIHGRFHVRTSNGEDVKGLLHPVVLIENPDGEPAFIAEDYAPEKLTVEELVSDILAMVRDPQA
jgi:hypothetical protein